MSQNPESRIHNLVLQKTANETLIYDLEINTAFCLNKTSAMVWELCDGKHSVAEIANFLNQTSVNFINTDLVWLALDQLKQHNLLKENSRFVINFNGLSRRQVIRKIGLASMVALPIISSVIAPQAIQSQSCQSVGQSCNPTGSVGNCCQGLAYCASFSLSNNICIECGSTNTELLACSAANPGDIAVCIAAGYRCCSGSTTLVPNYPGCDPDTGSLSVCVCD